jgi:hypothetical protein
MCKLQHRLLTFAAEKVYQRKGAGRERKKKATAVEIVGRKALIESQATEETGVGRESVIKGPSVCR